MRKVYFCGLCGTLYLNGRPFVCDNCKSNICFEEFCTSDEELEKTKGIAGLKIVEAAREKKVTK